jgi:hypothetical protein
MLLTWGEDRGRRNGAEIRLRCISQDISIVVWVGNIVWEMNPIDFGGGVEAYKFLLPFFTAIVGAAIAFLFAIKIEYKKKRIDERTKAYVDYVRAVVAMKFNNSKEGIANLTDAKARISIYGSAAVIQFMSIFAETSMVLNNDESIIRFLKIIECMRDETSNFVEPENLRKVLFSS